MELKRAEKMWILYVQRKHFLDMYSAISEKRKHNLQQQLGIFVDKDGLLRCRGRLQNLDFTEGARCPILLPKNDMLTSLIVQNTHRKLLHSGVSQTLSRIRYTYWIPQGHAIVRTVLQNCLVCRKQEGGPYKMPSLAPYPKSRLQESVPFSTTGLDYLGPIYVKHNGETVKRWVCSFTCVAIRAIHLELLNDMSTEEFLMAFRRFISVRGTPSEIISDNAMQFKSSSVILNSVWNKISKCEDVQNYVSMAGIKWVFITELAPWMGGFYERLVGIVKRSLCKTLGRKLLTDVQLHTTLKEIEAIVNTRPLVYVGDDVNSTTTLTPSNFLTINPDVGVPEIDYDLNDPEYKPQDCSADKLIKVWKKGQKLLNTLWQIWRDEYLLSLRERTQF